MERRARIPIRKSVVVSSYRRVRSVPGSIPDRARGLRGLAPYWPTQAWKTETPDKLGFDAAKLMAAGDFKTQYSSTQAVLVVRHGYVALEKYTGSSATSTQESYSMAKSFTSGLIGIAIGEGKLASTDAKICESYPMQWDCSDTVDPRSRIAVDNAMNLNTGLRWAEDWRSTATGTNDAYNVNLLDTVLARVGRRAGDEGSAIPPVIPRCCRGVRASDRDDRIRVRQNENIRRHRRDLDPLERGQSHADHDLRGLAGDRARLREVRVLVPAPR